eukprot:scaffold7916_cov286-Pinguiococcus_pyrenoidosus.AAC.2
MPRLFLRRCPDATPADESRRRRTETAESPPSLRTPKAAALRLKHCAAPCEHASNGERKNSCVSAPPEALHSLVARPCTGFGAVHS